LKNRFKETDDQQCIRFIYLVADDIRNEKMVTKIDGEKGFMKEMKIRNYV
jgi:hypothetical protein